MSSYLLQFIMNFVPILRGRRWVLDRRQGFGHQSSISNSEAGPFWAREVPAPHSGVWRASFGCLWTKMSSKRAICKNDLQVLGQLTFGLVEVHNASPGTANSHLKSLESGAATFNKWPGGIAKCTSRRGEWAPGRPVSSGEARAWAMGLKVRMSIVEELLNQIWAPECWAGGDAICNIWSSFCFEYELL